MHRWLHHSFYRTFFQVPQSSFYVPQCSLQTIMRSTYHHVENVLCFCLIKLTQKRVTAEYA